MARISPIPDPPDMSLRPWYAKDRTLPPYRFVPGLFPHPVRDPKGHSYRTGKAQIYPHWTPDQWKILEPYLRGVDLFNRFYFWEAHEAWEPLWGSCPEEAEAARFIQGLINLSASFLKLHLEERTAVQKLWNAAASLLHSLRRKKWMGIDLDLFLQDVDSFLTPLENGTLPVLGPDTPVIRLE